VIIHSLSNIGDLSLHVTLFSACLDEKRDW